MLAWGAFRQDVPVHASLGGTLLWVCVVCGGRVPLSTETVRGIPTGRCGFWKGERLAQCSPQRGFRGEGAKFRRGGLRKAYLTPEFPDLLCGSLSCGPWVGGMCSLRHCGASTLNRSLAPRYPGGKCITEKARSRVGYRNIENVPFEGGECDRNRSQWGTVCGSGV